ncbi:vasotocin-neurophysin VT 2-like [Triplophysa rosa]|uniref:Vasotocin-neurophysin VT 2 n=1 Tax=Triplophysa rosa TaxID=992332 RepID=A0A9W8CBG4_TRIRA|nr:vasotocin-neurophysin VT 2-like [Triplophysa rosa]KAI7813418.1 Vasotocin-neurophysin VT 2 [Triplophysa rosa]
MTESALLLLCVAGLLSLSSTCYIQNCPRGGKRSLDTVSRQCMTCGPGDQGRCFGPSLCCGEEIGCLLASPQTLRCQEEEYLPSPCDVPGKPCGSDEGRCAAPGLCCDTDGCMFDPSCSEDRKSGDRSEQSAGFLGASPGELLLHLLHVSNKKQNRL